MKVRVVSLGLAGFAALSILGCHSRHFDATLENRTGAEIRLLEVDYPNASFGSDSLANSGTVHFRFQVQGSGALKVQYTTPDGHQPQIGGPEVAEGEEGSLEIVLLPGGKAEFHPHFKTSQ